MARISESIMVLLMRKNKRSPKETMYEAHLYARVLIHKRFRIQAVSLREMIKEVLRLAQKLTPHDLRKGLQVRTVDELIDHGYEGDISIHRASIGGSQRRVVFSLGKHLVAGSRLASLEIQLPDTLVEELLHMVRESASNVLRAWEPRG